MPKPRQRTAAQRQTKEDEDASPLTAGDILDEQEQEQEIRELREKNQQNNVQSQNALDVGILICILISGIQIKSHFHSSSPIIPLLALIQLILLPLSLTPHFLPGPLRPGERTAEERLRLLEGAKYEVKGA
ncbi:hypothetical protein I312_103633 [Cryptococcus bacillisporus CA1280]|uniref:uncharacterized protein n=1 Tax=Cryptococcus bacillisporus CA1280 TaxID=1296109 RepID=UPI003368CA05